MSYSFLNPKFLQLLASLCILVGCQNPRPELRNTKWLLVEMKLDSTNSTLNIEKVVINTFHDSSKLYSEFKDSLMFAKVEGKEAVTSKYLLRDDTLFFSNNNLSDTNIILKLSKDSLIMRNLQGIKFWLIRQ